MAGSISNKEKLKLQLEELQKKMALKEKKLAEIKQKEHPNVKKCNSSSSKCSSPFTSHDEADDKHLPQNAFSIDSNGNYESRMPYFSIGNNIKCNDAAIANSKSASMWQSHGPGTDLDLKSRKRPSPLDISGSTDNSIGRNMVRDISKCPSRKKLPCLSQETAGGNREKSRISCISKCAMDKKSSLQRTVNLDVARNKAIETIACSVREKSSHPFSCEAAKFDISQSKSNNISVCPSNEAQPCTLKRTVNVNGTQNKSSGSLSCITADRKSCTSSTGIADTNIAQSKAKCHVAETSSSIPSSKASDLNIMQTRMKDNLMNSADIKASLSSTETTNVNISQRHDLTCTIDKDSFSTNKTVSSATSKVNGILKCTADEQLSRTSSTKVTDRDMVQNGGKDNLKCPAYESLSAPSQEVKKVETAHSEVKGYVMCTNDNSSLHIPLKEVSDMNVLLSKGNNISKSLVDKTSPKAFSKEEDNDFEDEMFEDNMTCVFANIATQDLFVNSSEWMEHERKSKWKESISNENDGDFHSPKVDVHEITTKRSAEILDEDSDVSFNEDSKMATHKLADKAKTKMSKKLKLDSGEELYSLESSNKPPDSMVCDKSDSENNFHDLSVCEGMFASPFPLTAVQKFDHAEDLCHVEKFPSVKLKNQKEEDPGDNFNAMATPVFMPLSKMAAKLEMESRGMPENSEVSRADVPFEKKNIFNNLDNKSLISSGFKEDSSNLVIGNQHGSNHIDHSSTPFHSAGHVNDVKVHIKDIMGHKDSKHVPRCADDQLHPVTPVEICRGYEKNSEHVEGNSSMKNKDISMVTKSDQLSHVLESKLTNDSNRMLQTEYHQLSSLDPHQFECQQKQFDDNNLSTKSLQEESEEKRGNYESVQEKPSDEISNAAEGKGKGRLQRKKVFPVSDGTYPLSKVDNTSCISNETFDDESPSYYPFGREKACQECLKKGIAMDPFGASTSSKHQSCSSAGLEPDEQELSNVVIIEDMLEGTTNDWQGDAYVAPEETHCDDYPSSSTTYFFSNQDVDQNHRHPGFQKPRVKFMMSRDIEHKDVQGTVENISVAVYKNHAEVFCVYKHSFIIYEGGYVDENECWPSFYHYDFGNNAVIKASLSLHNFDNMVFVVALSLDDQVELNFFNFTEKDLDPKPVTHSNIMNDRSPFDELFLSESGFFNFTLMAVSIDSFVCAYRHYNIFDEERGEEFHFVATADYQSSIAFTSIRKVHCSEDSVLLIGGDKLVLWNYEMHDHCYEFDLFEDIAAPGSVIDCAYFEREELYVLFSSEDEFQHRICRLVAFNLERLNCQIIVNYDYSDPNICNPRHRPWATVATVDILNEMFFVVHHDYCIIFDLLSGEQIGEFAFSDAVTAIACHYNIFFVALQRGTVQALYFTKDKCSGSISHSVKESKHSS